MQDLKAKREKLLAEAAECELIANLATDPGKRSTFHHLAKRLKDLAHDLETEIAKREARDAAEGGALSVAAPLPSALAK